MIGFTLIFILSSDVLIKLNNKRILHLHTNTQVEFLSSLLSCDLMLHHGIDSMGMLTHEPVSEACVKTHQSVGRQHGMGDLA